MTTEQNSSFHKKIVSRCIKEGKNFAISSLSISIAFQLVRLAANGKTKEEIIDLFGDVPVINIPEDFKLQIANSIWTTKEVSSEYAAEAKEKLNATTHKFNIGDGSPINQWCAEKTNNLIPQIVDNSLDPDIRAFLVNAIYFLADWLDQFDKNMTDENGNFYLYNGDLVKTPLMMKLEGSARYFQDSKTQYLSLPYECEDNKPGYPKKPATFTPHMIFALPAEGQSLAEFISEWNPLESAKRCYSQEYNQIVIPRFKVEWGMDLSNILAGLGIPTAFSENAEITKILASGEKLKIDSVVHKAVVKVDEKGTEAAAVTAIGFRCCAAMSEPEPKFNFIANRPFAFAIVEEVSQTVLFTGVVYDPTK